MAVEEKFSSMDWLKHVMPLKLTSLFSVMLIYSTYGRH